MAENIGRDFWPAMETSRRKNNKHWFVMAACCVVLLGIKIIACIPLFLHLFIAIPRTICAIIIAFENIFKETYPYGAPFATQDAVSGPASA